MGERRTQVVEKAKELFSERGYLATSMRDLADALQIEPASLYSHIKSKEDLLLDIANESANNFFEVVEEIAASQLATKEKLTQMIIAHVVVITQNINASAIFFSEWRHLSEENKEAYATRRDAYEDLFRQVVLQGIKENLFRNYDERFTSRTILSALNWTHTWYRPDGELQPEEIGKRLAETLLKGLIRTI